MRRITKKLIAAKNRVKTDRWDNGRLRHEPGVDCNRTVIEKLNGEKYQRILPPPHRASERECTDIATLNHSREERRQKITRKFQRASSISNVMGSTIWPGFTLYFRLLFTNRNKPWVFVITRFVPSTGDSRMFGQMLNVPPVTETTR